MRTSAWLVAGVALVGAAGAGLYAVRRDDNGRVEHGELSCPESGVYFHGITFAEPLTYDTPEEALAGALDVYEGVGTPLTAKGWKLDRANDEVARWELRDDGYLVGLFEFSRTEGAWEVRLADICRSNVEER